MQHNRRHEFTQGVSLALIEVIRSRPGTSLRKPSVEELATLSGYSTHHLHSLFRDHTGVTLGRYVKNVYLVTAAKDLIGTHLKIADIALSAGYKSQQTFSRAFRHKLGFSPTEFRALPFSLAVSVLQREGHYIEGGNV